MNRYKVQQVVLCEVRVWGYVDADSVQDAITKTLAIGTNSGEGFDYEITADREALSVSAKIDNN